MSYATIAQLKRYLGIDFGSTGDDLLLSNLLDRATKAIETYTGRVFEAATGTRYYDSEAINGQELYLDADLYSVTTLTNGDSSSTEIGVDYYTLLPRFGPPYNRIRLKSATATTYSWEVDTDYWISVLGTWGWSATPPDDVVHATIRLAAYYYAQKDAQVFDVTAVPEAGVITVPQGMPRDVEKILGPYKRMVLDL